MDFISRLVERVPPDRPGVLLGQRLAPAVARRPDPDVQDAPRGRRGRAGPRRRGGARTRCRCRCRSSARCSTAFGICRASAPTATRPTTSSAPSPPAPGSPVDVVTGDRDLFQLVDDDAEVRVLYIARGVGKHERVTNEWVRAKYAVDAAPVRRLRHPARRRLRRAARAWPASARRPRRPCWSGSATCAGIVAAAEDPDSDLGPGPRAQDQGRGRLPRGRAAGRRGRPRPRPAAHRPRPPPRPPTPSGSAPWPPSGPRVAHRAAGQGARRLRSVVRPGATSVPNDSRNPHWVSFVTKRGSARRTSAGTLQHRAGRGR